MITLNKSKIFWIILLMSITNQLSHALCFLPPNDNRLNEKSAPLAPNEITSDKIQTLIHEMLIISGHEADPNQTGKNSFLVGLAAPQIGVMKQIIIVDTRSYQEMKKNPSKPTFDVLINPTITWQSEELAQSREGCFSVPDIYMGTPKRSISVEVEAYDRNGDKFKKRYEGDTAFIVQHEIDHLKGTRFPERLESEKELHLIKDDSELLVYRKNWQNWDNHASFQVWQDMKKGLYLQ